MNDANEAKRLLAMALACLRDAQYRAEKAGLEALREDLDEPIADVRGLVALHAPGFDAKGGR